MAFWDDELLTGIEDIDNQHRELCEIASNLFSSFVEGGNDEKIQSTLIYFEKYVNEHFKVEEEFQIKIKYPDYELHKQEHDKFRKQIQRFQHIIETTGITEDFAEKFNLKIIDWLIFHFRETDGQLAKFVNANNARLMHNLNIL